MLTVPRGFGPRNGIAGSDSRNLRAALKNPDLGFCNGFASLILTSSDLGELLLHALSRLFAFG